MKELCGAGARLIAILWVILAALPNGGCGNHNNNADESPVLDTPYLPTPPPPRLLVSGDFSLPSNLGVASANKVVPFSCDTPGDLEATARWTPPSDAIVVGVYAAGCTSQQLGAGACRALNPSQHSSTSRATTVSVHSAPAGSYVLGFENGGPIAASGAYQVVVNPK